VAEPRAQVRSGMALPLLSLPPRVPTGVENGGPPAAKRPVPAPRTQAEAWAALTEETLGDEYKEVFSQLYDALIQEFQALGTLDGRLGVPYPDGRMTQESFVPTEDLIRACELTIGTFEICKNNLLLLVLQKEDEHYRTTYGAGLAGDGMQLPRQYQMIQMVLEMIKARDGIHIRLYDNKDVGAGKDPIAVRGERMDRMYVPEMIANSAHLLTWRETVAYIVRARQWVPNFFPSVRTNQGFLPIREIVEPDTGRSDPNRWGWPGMPGGERPWSLAPGAAYPTPYRANLTLEQAAAVMVEGQTAIILQDMLAYFQTLQGNPEVQECIRRLGTYSVNEFIGKARYVQLHHGPIDAWDVSKTQELVSIQPVRLRNTNSATAPSSVLSGLFFNVGRAEEYIADGRVMGPLRGWPSNWRHMHQQNWKIGMWFVRTNWKPEIALHSLAFAFTNNQHFNQYIGDWSVDNVTSLEATFNGAWRFNQPLRKWDVSNVDNIKRTFKYARAFDQGPGSLEGWGEKLTKVDKRTYRFEVLTFFEARALIRRFGQGLRFGPPAWGWKEECARTKKDASAGPSQSKSGVKLDLASDSEEECGE